MVIKGPPVGLELKFFELATQLVKENGLELYDWDWNASSGTLVLYIMNSETRSALLDDCIKIDRAFDPYLDSETWIPDRFNLEVSSPGLYRELTSVSHFKSVIGEFIQLHLNKKIDENLYPSFPKSMANSLKIKVLLAEVKENEIVVNIKNTLINVPYEQIKKANLETDIKAKKNLEIK